MNIHILQITCRGILRIFILSYIMIHSLHQRPEYPAQQASAGSDDFRPARKARFVCYLKVGFRIQAVREGDIHGIRLCGRCIGNVRHFSHQVAVGACRIFRQFHFHLIAHSDIRHLIFAQPDMGGRIALVFRHHRTNRVARFYLTVPAPAVAQYHRTASPALYQVSGFPALEAVHHVFIRQFQHPAVLGSLHLMFQVQLEQVAPHVQCHQSIHWPPSLSAISAILLAYTPCAGGNRRTYQPPD